MDPYGISERLPQQDRLRFAYDQRYIIQVLVHICVNQGKHIVHVWLTGNRLCLSSHSCLLKQLPWEHPFFP